MKPARHPSDAAWIARLSRRQALRLAGLASGLVVLTIPLHAQHAGHHHGSGAAPPKPPDPLSGRFGGAFTLTRHDGERVSERDFLGKAMLVYFGFTRCTETCPIDMPMIATALDRLGPLARKLTPVFVTVDPEDSPEILRDYLSGLDARFVGLTGSEAELAHVARLYRVHRRKLAVSAQSGRHTHQHHGGSYTIDHGSLTYLMDAKGQFLTLFPHGTGADRFAEVLKRYLEA